MLKVKEPLLLVKAREHPGNAIGRKLLRRDRQRHFKRLTGVAHIVFKGS